MEKANTVKFTAKMSETEITFLDTKVYKVLKRSDVHVLYYQIKPVANWSGIFKYGEQKLAGDEMMSCNQVDFISLQRSMILVN